MAASAAAIPPGGSLTVGAGGTFIFDPTLAGSPLAGVVAASPAADGVAAVPEPGTIALLLAALGGAGIYYRFRRRSQDSEIPQSRLRNMPVRLEY